MNNLIEINQKMHLIAVHYGIPTDLIYLGSKGLWVTNRNEASLFSIDEAEEVLKDIKNLKLKHASIVILKNDFTLHIHNTHKLYEQGSKVRYKNWYKNQWIKKYSNTQSIDENGFIDDFNSNNENWEFWEEYK